MKLNIKKYVGGYNESKSKKIKIYKGGNEFIKLVGGETVFIIRDILLNLNHIDLNKLDNKLQRKEILNKLNDILKLDIDNEIENKIDNEIDYLLKLDENQFTQLYVKKFKLHLPFSVAVKPLFMLIKEYYEKQVLHLMKILDIDQQFYLDKWDEIDKKESIDSSSIILFQLGKDKEFIRLLNGIRRCGVSPLSIEIKNSEKISSINEKLLTEFIDYITDESKWSYKGFCPLVPIVRMNYLLNFPLSEISKLINTFEEEKITTYSAQFLINDSLDEFKKIKLPYMIVDIPKKTLINYKFENINKEKLKSKIEKLIFKLNDSRESLIKWENYYIENAELFSEIYNIISKNK